MQLNSIHYLLFLLVTFLLYYSINSKLRPLVLLAASMLFITTLSFNLLLFTLAFVVLNYFFGIWLQKYADKAWRARLFWTTILINVGILSIFKYINFFLENVNVLTGYFTPGLSAPYLEMIIPVGISYYTFQAIGYLIRINRKAGNAEKNIVHFANFMIFFPKFLAGPIERSNHFLPQAKKAIAFNPDDVTVGLRLFLWGLFKKIVIADNLGAPVNLIYNNIENYTGVSLIVVFLIQAMHLYADFSGYTDMALGVARVFGIKLTPNFNRPFFARTVGEFWRRWHISLSSWCNDFIFAPYIVKYRKQGNRAAISGILITFFVIGIWHGANWTFVIIGLLQGVAIIYEFVTKRKRIEIAAKLNPVFVLNASRLLTFLFFCLTLVFFNSKNVGEAIYFLSHMFKHIELKTSGNRLIYDSIGFLTAFAAFIIVMVSEAMEENGISVLSGFLRQPRMVRWLGYYLLIAAIYYYNGAGNEFVYLKF